MKYGLRSNGDGVTEPELGRLGTGMLAQRLLGSPKEPDPHRWLSVFSSCDCTMLLRLRRYVLFSHLPTTPSP